MSRRFSLQVETSSRSLFSVVGAHHHNNEVQPIQEGGENSNSSAKEGGGPPAGDMEKVRKELKEHREHSEELVEQLRGNRTLNVDPNVGLSSREAADRLEKNGRNELPKDPPKSTWEMLLDQFSSVLVIMLLVSCVISMATGQFAAGLTIIIIVAFNALLGVVQEAKAGAALDALESLSAPTADVVRNGVTVAVSSSELVVGDIVILDLGKKISADLLLIDGQQLSVNEMALTGESEPVAKSPIKQSGLPELLRTASFNANKSEKSAAPKAEKENKDGGEEALTDPHCVYMGCTVVEGRGKGVVIKTGLRTKMGEVAHLLKEAEAGESPLQIKLGDLGVNLGIASMAVSALVFFLGIFTGRGADPNSDQPIWLQMLMIAVSLTVAAVPEGLPTCVTITLAIGMHNMVKKNALIRNLHSVETLGSASVICTDKTGTLTAGAMTATRLYFKREIYKFTGVGYSTSGKLLPLHVDDSPSAVSASVGQHTLPLLAAALCSNATIQNAGQADEQVIGNSSDKPIIVAAHKIGLNANALNSKFKRLAENPFNSMKKCMSVVVEANDANAFALFPSSIPLGEGELAPIAIVKGAPDVLLAKCVSIVDSTSSSSSSSSSSSLETRPMTDEDREYLAGVIYDFSSQALRVMAVCVRTLAPGSDSSAFSASAIESSLTFIGLMASIDPERPEVADAIAKANEAGIRVVMITGDYVATAVAIAKRVGILDDNIPDDQVALKAIDCAKLRELADQVLDVERKLEKDKDSPTLIAMKHSLDSKIDDLTAKVDVYSRAKPVDKITIVRSLQRQGHVVSMTGDGVNDAPALKQANIGVAMGVTGTDVAKAASDMVLTDDNFVSIVAAIEQGRTIYANIVKFCYFLLSTNVSEVFLILIAVLMGMQCPLLPIQILWLNLATDGAPAIALALEAEEPGLMSDGPRKLSEPLMDKVMYTGIFIQTVALTGVTLACFMIGLNDGIGNYYGIMPEDMEVSFYNEGVSGARTMTILLIVFAELLRAYTCRTLRVSIFDVGIFTNQYMQYSVGVSVALTLFFATNPFFMEVFSMTELTTRQWIIVFLLSLIPVTVDELTKLVYRRTGFGARPKFVSKFGYRGDKKKTQ